MQQLHRALYALVSAGGMLLDPLSFQPRQHLHVRPHSKSITCAVLGKRARWAALVQPAAGKRHLSRLAAVLLSQPGSCTFTFFLELCVHPMSPPEQAPCSRQAALHSSLAQDSLPPSADCGLFGYGTQLLSKQGCALSFCSATKFERKKTSLLVLVLEKYCQHLRQPVSWQFTLEGGALNMVATVLEALLCWVEGRCSAGPLAQRL